MEYWQEKDNMYDLIVIGGGPAGIFASIFAKNRGKKVLLLEKMEKLGKKLLIAGQGQCNLTHVGTKDDFIGRYGNNGAFLKKALYKYPPQSMIEFFEKRGLPLIATEKGKYFPKTLRSLDVLSLLKKELQGVEIRLNSPVSRIEKDEIFKVFVGDKEFLSHKLIIATGGKSYEVTGSSGDGYKFSKGLGLKIVEPKPSLTPVYINDYPYASLSGVSFRDIILEHWRAEKKVGEYRGDLLFTHKNFSGPVIIDNSRYMEKGDIIKVNYTGEKRESFEKSFRENLKGSKQIKNVFQNPNLSERFVSSTLKNLKIDEEKKAFELNKFEIKGIIEAFCGSTYEVSRLEGFNLAMATAGGVSLEEINKNTMESKKVKGLYIVGELLDIDGDTGGFNIQAAYSTGALAAENL